MMIVLDLIETIVTVIGGVLRVLFHVVDILVSFVWWGRDEETKPGANVPRDPPPPEAGLRTPHTSVPTVGDKNP
jgi:hypothetical protein